MKTTSLKTLAAAVGIICLASCNSDKPAFVGQLVAGTDNSALIDAEWISASDAQVITGAVKDRENSRAADGASWFVSEVKNEKKVTSALWTASGLGVFDLYLNGVRVGEEILKPGFTHYQKTKRSFTYDVTDAFVKGAGKTNQLSAQVTPGWWADKIVTPGGHEGMIGKKCAFRAVLELTYEDGGKQLFCTNTTDWKAGTAGPVKHSAIFDGEEYDAREFPGFACADKLGRPEVNDEFKGEILPTCGAEIYFREDLALSPVKTYVWKGAEGADDDKYGKVIVLKEYASGEPVSLHEGETLVVDFGQNAAAVPEFLFNAAEGTVLTCLPSEILNDGNGAKSRGMDGPEGSCHRTNLRNPQNAMRMVYTFASSKSPVVYRPRYTFFGYRYISVTASADVTISKMLSIPVTSISAAIETGKIETGNELVNKLISNTLWGQRSNYLSVTTDCPQRNERLGWTADTQVFTETGTFFANTDRFFHKWMRDMRDTQSEFGGFPGVAPLAQYGAEPDDMMRLGWADAGVIVPWTVWKQFGDTSIIEENWAAMERFINHIDETKYDHNTLKAENGNYQWADWLSYEPLESNSGKAFKWEGKKRGAPLPDAVEYWNYLSASYWAIDAAMMRDMAAASGKDAAKYEAMTARAKDYLKSRFFTADGKFKNPVLNTMQTPALFAMKNCLVEGKALEDMIARLRENFKEHDNCLQTGFLGTSILMGTLTDYGMSDIAYELLFQKKNPSWLYSVDNGATTIWERWNSYMKEYGMGPKGMNSFNHYAYGCVCQWIWETAAGICADSAKPGFKHIIMKPVPDKRLGSIKAEYQSAAGLITSAWRYEGDKWIWEFSIPEGAAASVTLPGETEARDYAPGKYSIEK